MDALQIPSGIPSSRFACSVVMADRKQDSNPLIQLDVDWLVGKRADPRHLLPSSPHNLPNRSFEESTSRPLHKRTRSRRLSSNVVGGSIGVVTAALLFFTWPYLSARWLEAHMAGGAEPFTAPFSSEQHSSMVAELEQLSSPDHANPDNPNPDHTNLVFKLNSESPEQRQFAFMELSHRIRSFHDSDKAIENWLSVANALNCAPMPNEESQRLRSLLIEQMATLSSNRADSLEKRALDALCYAILPRSDWQGILRFNQTPQPWIFEQDSRSNPLVYKLSNIDSISSAGLGWETHDWGNAYPQEQRMVGLVTSPTEEKSYAFLDRSSQVLLPAIPGPSIERATSQQDFDLDDEDKVIDSYVGSTVTSPVSLVSSSKAKASSVSISKPQLLFQGTSAAKPVQSIRVDVQPLLSLLTMLKSEQESTVRQACEELFRRRVPTEVVDLALALAREQEDSQLELLEEVVQLESSLSLPLLNWLARTSGWRTRHRAITLIGAMQDQEAIQTLRGLAQRESDPQLQQMIHKSLANSGHLRQSINVGAQ